MWAEGRFGGEEGSVLDVWDDCWGACVVHAQWQMWCVKPGKGLGYRQFGCHQLQWKLQWNERKKPTTGSEELQHLRYRL